MAVRLGIRLHVLPRPDRSSVTVAPQFEKAIALRPRAPRVDDPGIFSPREEFQRSWYGMDIHNLKAFDNQGRSNNLLEEGMLLVELLELMESRSDSIRDYPSLDANRLV